MTAINFRKLSCEAVALTTNAIKLEEFRALYPYLRSQKTELIELQNPDPCAVVQHKLDQVKNLEPSVALIVEDTGLAISGWGRLPGAYIKSFLTEFGPAGLLEILPQSEDLGAVATSAVGVAFQGRAAVISDQLAGDLVSPSGTLGGWTPIFHPKGETTTLAALPLERRLAITMRRVPFIGALKWLEAQVSKTTQTRMATQL